MNFTRLAFLILIPAALSMAGCRGRNSTYAAWPFRGDAAAADFGGGTAPHSAMADPWQRERTRLREQAQLAQQQTTEPVRHASLNTAAAQPFPSSLLQASHEQTTVTEEAKPKPNPFAAAATQNQKWQSSETRVTAKVR